MVTDKLENAYLYAGLSAKIKKGLEILKDEKLSAKKDGRYEIDGDNIYCLVQRYTTKPIEEGRLEAHKKYIDIQFAAEGEEVIGHSELSQLNIEKPYDEAKDVAFYEVPEKINTVKLSKGMFCILFPQDGHMPCCQLAGPCEVLKVVVKVKIGD
ncbi:MAG: YhcH/YjgK/YiaL family protein [Phycisphaerae bacterium]|nr:YhcH/YjgK/YiaL family protein [Phycisphaerae bacterium]MDD5380114.1 YhcH/YjgK/YiaL family protein [Phycisphaerae bacterium]